MFSCDICDSNCLLQFIMSDPYSWPPRARAMLSANHKGVYCVIVVYQAVYKQFKH